MILSGAGVFRYLASGRAVNARMAAIADPNGGNRCDPWYSLPSLLEPSISCI